MSIFQPDSANVFMVDPTEDEMAMDCFLDDSGTGGEPVVALAGFVGRRAIFRDLEKKWDRICAKFGVGVLHATDFHDTKGDFANWERTKKRRFVEELFNATDGRRIAGISIGFPATDFKEHKQESDTFHQSSAVGMCFGTIIGHIITDMVTGSETGGINFSVEQGNKNSAEVQRHFESIAKLEGYKPALASFKFVKKDSSRAVQIADLLAFHSRRLMDKQYRAPDKEIVAPCEFIQMMKKHIGVHIALLGPRTMKPLSTERPIGSAAGLRAFKHVEYPPVVSTWFRQFR
jgi:Protein of unknown function (DUF3800)